MIQRENELKDLRRQLDLVLDEQHSLNLITSKQQSVLTQYTHNNKDEAEMLIQLEEEYRTKREYLKNTQKDNLKLDKKLRERHDLIVGKNHQVHQLAFELET